MNTTEFEKIAGQLATCAVTRDPSEIGQIKQAAGYTGQILQYLGSPAGKYVLGGLGGAGLGALVGATQPKRKGRNAIYYGALGGLGGLGLAHLINSAGRGPTTRPDTHSDTNKEPAAQVSEKTENNSPPSSSVSQFLDDISKPAVSGAEPPKLTGRLELDAPMQAAHAAQQLPGMEGVSPVTQAGLGSVGLYAGVRGSRPLTGLFARGAERGNTAATNAVNAAIKNREAWITGHNAQVVSRARDLGEQALAQARDRGQQAVDTLRNLGVTDRNVLRRAYQNHVQPVSRAAAQQLAAAESLAARELAAVTRDNAQRLNRVNTGNALRSFRGRAIPQFLRSIIMGGTTYAGATAPNWMPELYGAVNDRYRDAVK